MFVRKLLYAYCRNPGGSQSPVTGDITAAVVLISSLSALALVAAFGVSKRKSVK